MMDNFMLINYIALLSCAIFFLGLMIYNKLKYGKVFFTYEDEDGKSM